MKLTPTCTGWFPCKAGKLGRLLALN